jgi:hypothetical protein
MSVEAVARISGVQILHLPIPDHFGDNRRRRDGGTAPIALPYGTLRHGQVGDAKRIDENDVGHGPQVEDRALHRPQRRLMDVEPVDFARIGGRHAPRQGVPQNDLEQTIALGGRRELGIPYTGNRSTRIQDDRGRNHWPSQAASPDLTPATAP